MKNKLLKNLAALVALMLVLSGCIREELNVTVGYDDSTSGVIKFTVPEELLLEAAGALFNEDLGNETPFGLTSKSAESRTGCALTNLEVTYNSATVFTSGYMVMRLDAPNSSDNIYVYGDISSGQSLGDEYSSVAISLATIVPKSGLTSDCADFSSLTNGVVSLATSNQGEFIGNSKILGSLDQELYNLQFANLGIVDREYLSFVSLIYASSEQENFILLNPELESCFTALADPAMNELLDHLFLPGQLNTLLNSQDKLRVYRDQIGITLECSYEDLALEDLHRRNPADNDQPVYTTPAGVWSLDENEAVWHFDSETSSSPATTVLDPESNLSNMDLLQYTFTYNTGQLQNLKIQGVVLGTNGQVDSDNTVSWVFRGLMDFTVPGGQDTPTQEMDVVIGRVVNFKSNSTKFATTKTQGGLTSIMNALKQEKPSEIQIVAIENGSLAGAAATANENLVVKRAQAIKNKLKTAKIKGAISIVYVSTSDGSVSKANNQVVIRSK